ncbi:MAG: PIN domain-containing protein, partial [Chloroflexi bacterium]|nr:PIN domain-containing protein [Chloroflexota bacterium]
MLESSVLVPEWSRFVLQRLAAPGRRRFAPVWSEWIVAETWRVLTWRWLAQAGRVDQAEWRALTRGANTMLRYLVPAMTLVSIRDFTGPAPWPELKDPDDAPIWESAIIAGAQYVVSHNTGDFPPLVEGRHLYRGVEYLTTIEFVEDVLGEDAAALHGEPLPFGA